MKRAPIKSLDDLALFTERLGRVAAELNALVKRGDYASAIYYAKTLQSDSYTLFNYTRKLTKETQ
jgi:hypothetical protein